MALRSFTLSLPRVASLAMAGRTARQFSDLVFLNQFRSQRALISRRLIRHVENFLARTHEAFRRTMTVETPIHVERVFPPYQRHLVNTAVTGRTSDSFVNVNAMIEIDETG